jgi:hypothetical protein
MIWEPKPIWKGQDAILIGGGPSLQKFPFAQLKGRNVIGCNDAFRLGHEVVKFCVFGDASWWNKNKWELEKFQGGVVTCAPSLLHLQCDWLLQIHRNRDGLFTGGVVGWNHSTGAVAINLALSMGAGRVFLLGYDLGYKYGQSHWHRWNNNRIEELAFRRFSRGFQTIAREHGSKFPGSRIFTVTQGESRLHAFQRIKLDEFWRLVGAQPILQEEEALQLQTA